MFDEPDAHIHIGKQKKLRELIDTENRFSLVTTHSPVFLEMLYNDNNICYMNEGKVLNTDKLKQINTLSDGEINYFEGAFILSSKKTLVTEGKYDGKYLKKAIEVFSKTDKKYLRLNEIAIIQAGGASNAVALYEETLQSLLPQIEKLVFLFDYDKGGFDDGWNKIDKIKGSDGKILPLFYQHNYTSFNTTKPNLSDTILVEDLFSEKSYSKVAAKVHVATHKEFRNIQWDNGIKGTANAIKYYIEKNYLSFEDEWYDGFKPVLDKLMEVFDLN